MLDGQKGSGITWLPVGNEFNAAWRHAASGCARTEELINTGGRQERERAKHLVVARSFLVPVFPHFLHQFGKKKRSVPLWPFDIQLKLGHLRALWISLASI
jgi:hypothetical protein